MALDDRPGRYGEPGAAHQQQRFAAEAAAEAADAIRIDPRRVARIGQHCIERGAQRLRPNGLHRRVVGKIQDRLNKVVETVETNIGDARVAMKRRDRDIALAGEDLQRIDVVTGDRAAAQPVREQQHRKPLAIVGKDRRLGAALHVGHRRPRRQRIVGTAVGSRCRVADERAERQRAIAKVAIELAVIGKRDVRRRVRAPDRLNRSVT